MEESIVHNTILEIQQEDVHAAAAEYDQFQASGASDESTRQKLRTNLRDAQAMQRAQEVVLKPKEAIQIPLKGFKEEVDLLMEDTEYQIEDEESPLDPKKWYRKTQFHLEGFLEDRNNSALSDYKFSLEKGGDGSNRTRMIKRRVEDSLGQRRRRGITGFNSRGSAARSGVIPNDTTTGRNATGSTRQPKVEVQQEGAIPIAHAVLQNTPTRSIPPNRNVLRIPPNRNVLPIHVVIAGMGCLVFFALLYGGLGFCVTCVGTIGAILFGYIIYQQAHPWSGGGGFGHTNPVDNVRPERNRPFFAGPPRPGSTLNTGRPSHSRSASDAGVGSPTLFAESPPGHYRSLSDGQGVFQQATLSHQRSQQHYAGTQYDPPQGYHQGFGSPSYRQDFGSPPYQQDFGSPPYQQGFRSPPYQQGSGYHGHDHEGSGYHGHHGGTTQFGNHGIEYHHHENGRYQYQQNQQW